MDRKEYYYLRKKSGLCVQCGKPNDRLGEYKIGQHHVTVKIITRVEIYTGMSECCTYINYHTEIC
jgi:hypothetical protein